MHKHYNIEISLSVHRIARSSGYDVHLVGDEDDGW